MSRTISVLALRAYMACYGMTFTFNINSYGLCMYLHEQRVSFVFSVWSALATGDRKLAGLSNWIFSYSPRL